MNDITMMDIDPALIPRIEEALGIKLYIDQKKYLIGENTTSDYASVRRSGSTTAYCIKLALSSGEPLDIRDTTSFSDAYISGLTREHAVHYSRYFFVHEFRRIQEKLSNYGFPVRELTYSKRPKGGFVIDD